METKLAPPITGLPLTQGRWTIDAPHSAVVFSIRHLGLSKVRGRFDQFDAALEIGASLEETKIEATVDMASVDTNNADRDTHLRSTDFFNIERHPTMRFESTEIARTGEEWALTGNLTMNGVTRPVTFEVEFNGVEDHPANNRQHAGFSATGELRRSDFGIDFGMLPIGVDKLALSDAVKFELELQFVEPETTP